MLYSFIKNKFNAVLRKLFINPQNRYRLKNQGMSVLSSNCNGAFILHDLGQPFNSPFVNLYLEPKDFIRYLQNIDHYLNQELSFIKGSAYPIAYLDDIKIHFLHYKNAQQAKEKWQERSQRINFDNLFIILTARDNYSEQDLIDFDALPYKNKIIFTHMPYPKIKSAFYIESSNHHSPDLFLYTGWNGKRYYDKFNYVNWFNSLYGSSKQ